MADEAPASEPVPTGAPADELIGDALPTRVLMVEDNPVDARVLESALTSDTGWDLDFDVRRASDLATGLECLLAEKFHVALLDLALPDAYGLEVVEQAQATAPETPLVVLTGRDDSRLARVALGSGAQDYLVKGSFNRDDLVRTISYAIERKNLQLQQLAEKDRFVSLVSHELRNPLTVIHATLEMLGKRAVDIDEAEGQLLELARKNTRQLCTMIDDLVDSAAATSARLDVRPERSAVGPIVLDVVDQLVMIAERRGIVLTASVPDGMPDVIADQERIRQVLVNLVSNSFKHTTPGGTVMISASTTSDRVPASDGAGSPDDMVEFRIDDTGCGIPEEHVAHVFERHYRIADQSLEPSRQGLGLGLYVCQTLVHKHGGDIWIDSIVGKGTTVHFTLPIAPPPEVPDSV